MPRAKRKNLSPPNRPDLAAAPEIEQYQMPADPGALPGSRPFARPSERPGEPVTAGMNMGPGPGAVDELNPPEDKVAMLALLGTLISHGMASRGTIAAYRRLRSEVM